MATITSPRPTVDLPIPSLTGYETVSLILGVAFWVSVLAHLFG